MRGSGFFRSEPRLPITASCCAKTARLTKMLPVPRVSKCPATSAFTPPAGQPAPARDIVVRRRTLSRDTPGGDDRCFHLGGIHLLTMTSAGGARNALVHERSAE